jgi:hypothetical protein
VSPPRGVNARPTNLVQDLWTVILVVENATIRGETEVFCAQDATVPWPAKSAVSMQLPVPCSYEVARCMKSALLAPENS